MSWISCWTNIGPGPFSPGPDDTPQRDATSSSGGESAWCQIATPTMEAAARTPCSGRHAEARGHLRGAAYDSARVSLIRSSGRPSSIATLAWMRGHDCVAHYFKPSNVLGSPSRSISSRLSHFRRPTTETPGLDSERNGETTNIYSLLTTNHSAGMRLVASRLT